MGYFEDPGCLPRTDDHTRDLRTDSYFIPGWPYAANTPRSSTNCFSNQTTSCLHSCRPGEIIRYSEPPHSGQFVPSPVVGMSTTYSSPARLQLRRARGDPPVYKFVVVTGVAQHADPLWLKLFAWPHRIYHSQIIEGASCAARVLPFAIGTLRQSALTATVRWKGKSCCRHGCVSSVFKRITTLRSA